MHRTWGLIDVGEVREWKVLRDPPRPVFQSQQAPFGVIAAELSLARSHLELGRRDVIGEHTSQVSRDSPGLFLSCLSNYSLCPLSFSKISLFSSEL